MSYKHFTKDERNEISVLLKKGFSCSDIGKALGKDHSSVSREIKRNSVKEQYDPKKADVKSRVKRINAKYQNMKIREHAVFEKYLEEKLMTAWTPEQIAGRWKLNYPQEKHFSSKSIYKYLYSSYGQRLCKYLPSKRYHKRKRGSKKQKKQIIKNRISIEKRPLIINLRKRFGDFEADVLGAVQTDKERLPAIVERKSRKLFAVKVPGLKYAMDGFKQMLKPYRDILKSVTFDNGVENVRHKELNVKTYFTHPYSAWVKDKWKIS